MHSFIKHSEKQRYNTTSWLDGRYATPHGVVGNAASPTATDREPLTGFGGCVWERPRATTDMETLAGMDGMRKGSGPSYHEKTYQFSSINQKKCR